MYNMQNIEDKKVSEGYVWWMLYRPYLRNNVRIHRDGY